MRIKIDVDEETEQRLLEAAIRERRSIPLQAEVLIMRALGIERCCDHQPGAEVRDAEQ